MSSREEFEAWAASPAFGLSPGHFKKDEDGEYINYPAHCYWLVWQASRQALVVALPSKISHLPHSQVGDGIVLPEAEQYDEAIDDCREAIEAAGVRVKSDA